MMRKITIVLAFSLLPILCVANDFRFIHVIKILDSNSNDEVIREASTSVSLRIDNEVSVIAGKLGINHVFTYELSGGEFNKENIFDTIEHLEEYGKRDIVFVVYLGHGFRRAYSNTEYPSLYLNSYTQSVDYFDILKEIYEKKPSYVVSIILACNKTKKDAIPKTPTQNENDAVIPADTEKSLITSYHDLFGDINKYYCNSIEFIAAEKYKNTFLFPDGGIFFNEIFNTLQGLVKSV